MNIANLGLFIITTFRSFWNFLFTPVIGFVSFGSIVIVLMFFSLLISFFFRGN